MNIIKSKIYYEKINKAGLPKNIFEILAYNYFRMKIGIPILLTSD